MPLALSQGVSGWRLPPLHAGRYPLQTDRAERAVLPVQGYLFSQVCWCQRSQHRRPHPESEQEETDGANLRQRPPGHCSPALGDSLAWVSHCCWAHCGGRWVCVGTAP